MSSQNCLVALACLFLMSCGSVQQLTIPPQQKVVLSGGDQGVYDIKIINKGINAVRISEELEHGESIDQGFLSRGDKRRLSFLSGSEAVFSNVLSDTVYLKLRVFNASEVETRQNLIQ